MSANDEVRQSFEIQTQFQQRKEEINDAQTKLKAEKSPGEEVLVKLADDLTDDRHICPLEELVERLGSNIEVGLTSTEAALRLKQDGPNCLTPPVAKPGWMVFLHHLFSGFAALLWFAAFISLVGYALQPTGQENLYLGMVLIIVVSVTAIFSYYQDAKALAVMKGFSQMKPKDAEVLRDGKKIQLPPENIVKGDILYVKGGNIVPADIRIFECMGLKVDNSSLTGESEPQSRGIECTDDNPLETKNLAFYSTAAKEGTAMGIVISCGDHTVIGKIADLVSNASSGKTPIRIEIEHFIKIITTIALILGVIFFAFGVFVYPIITNVVFTIGIVVANVPEGLLATVTVALTLTAQRMEKKNVVVKNLESVETLGSTTTICSDKTGTLTQNRMTCVHLWYDNQITTTETATTEATWDPESYGFQQLLRCILLCNNAQFLDGEESKPILQRSVSGDASEAALLKFSAKLHDPLEYRAANRKLVEIPFKSANKYQVSIHVPEDPSEELLLVIKGAPERIFARCGNILVDGQLVPYDDHWKQTCIDTNDTLCSMGERVLGFGMLKLDPSIYTADYAFEIEPPNFPMEGFTFLGLTGLIDPPRYSVPDAVKTCQAAGIKVIMVTGDHPTTAKAIAKQVNIITGDDINDVAKRENCSVDDINPDDHNIRCIVVTGTELSTFSDEDLDRVLDYDEIVFARTSPEQKLQIVTGCQKKKQIVAVTGDGVNDSPALKKADIGIAMGITGSDVSKEAADMILNDDNFASIVKGVEEGRKIFDNLKKSIAYTLSSNIPEIIPFVCFILFQFPLPLSTVLILCVDVGTDLIPAISLAYEEAESDIMKRRPRDASIDKLVTARLMSFAYLQIGVMQACAGMFTYFVVMGDFGFPPASLPFIGKYFDSLQDMGDVKIAHQVTTHEQRINALANAQTAYFVSIVIVQWADLCCCKTRMLSIFQQGMRNMVLNFGLFSETILAVFICYTPLLPLLIGTAPIAPRHWFPALPFCLLILSYDELRKLWMRNNRGGWVEQNTYY